MIIGGHGQTHIFAAKYDHCHLKTIFQSKWQFSSQMGERESSCLQILCVRFHRSHCLLYSRICKSPSSVFSGSHLIALYDSMSSLPPACLFPPITANPASLSSLYHHYHHYIIIIILTNPIIIIIWLIFALACQSLLHNIRHHLPLFVSVFVIFVFTSSLLSISFLSLSLSLMFLSFFTFLLLSDVFL